MKRRQAHWYKVSAETAQLLMTKGRSAKQQPDGSWRVLMTPAEMVARANFEVENEMAAKAYHTEEK